MSFGDVYVRCSDANTIYTRILAALLGEREKFSPRGMETSEARGACVILDDPRRCVVSITERRLNYHFMVAEWWWIASGDNRTVSITHYCKDIGKFSDDGTTFFGAYGPRWRGQIDAVISNIKKDKDSRQAVITVFRPELWNLLEGGVGFATKDVPCTISMQYMIRNNRLETIATMRSWDAWLGLPYDLFNFARLGAMIAGELGIEQGPLMVQAGSLHLYERNYAQAQQLISGVVHHDSPQLESLPGMLNSGQMQAWEQSARCGYIATSLPPWEGYMRVLADRKEPRSLDNVNTLKLPQPFKDLLDAGYRSTK